MSSTAFLGNQTTKFTDHGRPSKRQKTDLSSSPRSPPRKGLSTPKSALKKPTSVMIFGSQGREKQKPQPIQDSTHINHSDQNYGETMIEEAPFPDPNYYPADNVQQLIDKSDEACLETTPSRKSRKSGRYVTEEVLTNATLSEDQATPTRKRVWKRGVNTSDSVSDRPNEGGSQRAQDDFGKPPIIGVVGEDQSGSEANDTAPRSSRRARKKTQKQLEAEEADTIVLVKKTPQRRPGRRASASVTTPKTSLLQSKSIELPKDPQSSAQQYSTSTTKPSTGRRRGRPPKVQPSVATEESNPEVINFENASLGMRTTESASPLPLNTDVLENGVGMPSLEDVEMVFDETLTPSKKINNNLIVVQNAPQKTDEVLIPNTNGSTANHSARLAELKAVISSPDGIKEYAMLKSEIQNRLSGKRRLPLIDLGEEYSKTRQVIDQTISGGEGNSMMVIGPRGSAKTTMVETIISEMSQLYGGDFHVIRLNGFIHTDDKIALKEIWRQLGREMQIEDENAGRNNYADIMASLLALLSHPSEISQNETDEASKSVIFVIDEFDLFATHPRQTLLYNLFDIAQARKAPIAVLGLTTKIDVTESLEKRVKSRFSHRYVYLPLPKTYDTFLDILRAALLCSEPENQIELSERISQPVLTAWMAYANALIGNELISTYLNWIYYQNKSIPQVMSALLASFLLSQPNSPLELDNTISQLVTLTPPESKLVLLHGLSSLALALLIAAARLDIALSTDAVTFAMAYEEYVSLADRTRVVASAGGANALSGATGGGRVWCREVALGAWETLCDLSLLVAVGGDTKSGEGRLWRCDVSLEEIGEECKAELGPMNKWCREMAI